MEMYLQSIPNYTIRKNLTKIRTRTHSFEIEMGRYKNKSGKYISTSERQCNFCNQNLVEDEQHVIMVCDNYNDSRKEMLEKLAQIFPQFTSKNQEEKFISIMGTKDVELINITCKYLQDLTTIRGIM